LIQNRFADSGPVRDLVHAGGVVAAIDEDIAGDAEQLTATLVSGQPVATPARSRNAVPGPTAFGRFDGTPRPGFGEFTHRVLI
jgi:hypothetical protein